MSNKTTRESFSIISDFELSQMLIDMGNLEIRNHKEAKQICSKYNIHLYKMPIELKIENCDSLGVIKSNYLDDIIILFDKFFVFYNRDFYKVYYEDIECIKNSTNEFWGKIEKIDIKEEKLKKINYFIEETGSSNSPVNNDHSQNRNNEYSKNIRKSLKKYKEHKNVLCLECGYEGFMGVEKRKVPWYVSWPILILFILSGVGFLPALALGFFRSSRIKYYLKCPNCNTVIGPIRGI